MSLVRKPMRLFVLIFSFLASLLLAPNGTAQDAAKTKVSLLADHAQVSPGQTIQLGLRLHSEPHWHTYWKNPGDAGKATEVEWENSANATLGEWQWPAPKLFRQDTIFNFVYEGDTIILIPLTVAATAKPGDKISLKGEVSWLECDDRMCVPQDGAVSLTLPVAAKPQSANDEIFAKARAAIPVSSDAWQFAAKRDGTTLTLRATANGTNANSALSGLRFFSADAQVPPSATPKITIEGNTHIVVFDVKDASEKSGPTLTGVLTAEVSFLKDNPAAKAIQVAASLTSTAPNTASAPTDAVDSGAPLAWSDWTLAKQTELLALGKIVYVDFTARWCATCQLNKHVYGTDAVVEAFRKNNVALLRADWTKRNPEITAELAKYNRAAVPFNVFLSGDTVRVELPELLTAGIVLENLDLALGGKSVHVATDDRAFALQLVFAFIGGLILNLMPCVFPVLGLKIMNFVGQAGENRRKIASHGLVFTGGVVMSFWILAGVLRLLRMQGSFLGWGYQLQEPGFVLGMAVLFLVFAMNMAGIFEIGGSAVGVGSKLTGKSGLSGSFFSGVLAVLVATPCSAPFLAAALGSAVALPLVPSYLFFTAIALGLAAPYLLLSVAPGLMRFLPRPGAWMESFKQGLSFLLFGTVLYLLWVLAAQVDSGSLPIFLGMAVIALSCWIYGRWGAIYREPKTRLIGTSIAALLFLGTCVSYYTLLR